MLKAVHAVTQASSAYAKLAEAGEIEARLAELQSEVAALKEGMTLRRVV